LASLNLRLVAYLCAVPDRPTLEEAIALLEATLDATHDALLLLDGDGRIVRGNRPCLQLFGCSAAELERGGMELVRSRLRAELDDPEPTLARWRDAPSDPAAERLDVLRFKDGRIFEHGVAAHRAGSRIVGRVVSFHDIGTSVRAAEALEEHRSLLEQAQRVAHIGTWVAELDGSDRLEWSAESHRIFGVPLGTFAGTSEAFFAFVHADDRDAVRAESAAALAGERLYDIEHRILRHDATVRWVHERAHIIRDAAGQPLRMIGTVQDTTERRHLEDQLRQSQKMEAIGRLAGGIAHDLNNSLTAIAGYAELALGELPTGNAARADVDEIRRAAERAGSVTRQLLAFSRKQLLEPRIFDLNETVRSIARLLSRLLGPAIRLQTELADDDLAVLGDPGQIEQALINLAVNARDAMPDGGQLTLSTGREAIDEQRAHALVPMPSGRYVRLRVADTGHGMSDDTRSRIFEPFFTTKEPGQGTGLGLSMVYGTLKQIGGFIFVDSEIGRGTTFTLFFPVVRRGEEQPRPAPSRASERRGHETVLIVEDEPAVRGLIASALRNEGYQLMIASSAEEALTLAGEGGVPIDLLLTDATMPGGSGVELASLLTTRSPGLPVIIMSGYTEEALSMIDPGVELLQKPFTPRDLRLRIRQALGRNT
jgi:two-component system, cell cycle sensor histidine kinase and response regulator CckA